MRETGAEGIEALSACITTLLCWTMPTSTARVKPGFSILLFDYNRLNAIRD
jgi:hypothetical protein